MKYIAIGVGATLLLISFAPFAAETIILIEGSSSAIDEISFPPRDLTSRVFYRPIVDQTTAICHRNSSITDSCVGCERNTVFDNQYIHVASITVCADSQPTLDGEIHVQIYFANITTDRNVIGGGRKAI